MRISIKHKLFFTLLLTSVVVAVSMFLFMQWNFDRGMLNYVNNQEREQLDQLTQKLGNHYQEHGSWQFLLEKPGAWQQLQGDSLRADFGEQTSKQTKRRLHFAPAGSSDHRRPPPLGGNLDAGGHLFRPGQARADGNVQTRRSESSAQERRHPLPPFDDPRGFGPRIVLFGADRLRIVGGPPDEELNLKLKPISVQDKIIGYLGLIPARELSDAGDLLFVEEQTDSFALAALGMAALSLLLSFPIASHLLRPIKALTGGTRKLIAGQFKTRIPVIAKDELGQLSDDFNSLAITLENNEQARQQWVADISHELRTPLSVLRGEIEAMQDGVRQPSSQVLATLHDETLHLGRLVDDLYELSMSDIGALNYKKVRVDPFAILAGTIELFAPRFAQNGLRLSTDLPRDRAFLLLADPDRLQQLFTNLLENSLRYTDSPGQLKIRMEGSRKTVIFHFQDSAPGVPSPQLPKLFDRLFRVEESRNRAQGGAGLGMAICKNIVEAHRGRIGASRSPQGGLWIKVELPLNF